MPLKAGKSQKTDQRERQTRDGSWEAPKAGSRHRAIQGAGERGQDPKEKVKRKKQKEYQFPAHTHAEQPEFRCYACELAVCLADMGRLLGLPATMLQEVNVPHVRRTNGLASITDG